MTNQNKLERPTISLTITT